MDDSKALEIINNWYASKFEQNYTQEVSDEIVGAYQKEIVNQSKDTKGLESILGGVKEIFSVESQVQGAKEYFSSSYAILEDLIEKGVPQGTPLDVLEQYSDALAESKGALDNLVDGVKKLSAEGTLQDLGIEGLFKDTFGSYEGFASHMQNVYAISINYYGDVLERGIIDENTYMNFVGATELLANAAPYISKAVLEDVGQRHD